MIGSTEALVPSDVPEQEDGSVVDSKSANNEQKNGSVGSRSADDANAEATAKNDGDVSTSTDAQRWTNRLGALILFFEENGHTFVPRDYKDRTLHAWVKEQRRAGVRGELPPRREKQLLIFDFEFAAAADDDDDRPRNDPRPSRSSRHCKHPGCAKFAAFNGFCHGHFVNDNSPPKPKDEPTKNASENIAAAAKKRKKPRDDGDYARLWPKKKLQKKIEFPLIGLKRTRGNSGNYRIESVKEKVKDISRDEVVDKLAAFVREMSEVDCANRTTGVLTGCACMKFLSDKPLVIESTAHALMDYFDLDHVRRKHYCVERLRYAEMVKGFRKDPSNSSNVGPPRVFSLPLSYEYFERRHPPDVPTEGENEDGEEDSESYARRQRIIGQAFKQQICAQAFHALHNVGVAARQTLDRYSNGDVAVGRNGNKGKKWPGGVKYVEAYDSMRDSLESIVEEERERQRVGPEDDVVLPLGISRRQCYERWSRERGWCVTKKRKDTGQYERPGAWELAPGFYRTEEEAIENGGDAKNVPRLAVSWALYSRFWTKEFPQLKTQGKVGKGMFGGAYDFQTKKYYNRNVRQKAEDSRRQTEGSESD